MTFGKYKHLLIAVIGSMLTASSFSGLYGAEPFPGESASATTGNTSPPAAAPSYDELVSRLAALEEEVAKQKEQPLVEPAVGCAAMESIEEVVPCEHSVFGNVIGMHCECPACKKKAEAHKSKYPNVRLSGFGQVDAGLFSQDTASRAYLGDIQDGADFRRARLQAVGDLWENVGISIELDFAAPGRPSFMDVWMEVRDVPVFGNIRVGQFRQPFGMEEQTSTRDLTFLEYGLTFALAPFRQIGVMAYDSHEESGTTWAISGFRFPTDVYGSNIGDDGGYSLASRLSTLVYENSKNHELVHLGGSYGLIFPANGSSAFKITPEFQVSELAGDLVPPGVPSSVPPFVNTGSIPTDHYQIFNIESAYQNHSFLARSEARWARIDQVSGDCAVFFSAYGNMAYLLTGEIQPYNKKTGVFTRIRPHNPFKPGCGWGAWEVATRLSWIDLDSGDINGGQLCDYTAAVNWYLNDNTKFQFNYIYAMLDGDTIPQNNTSIIAFRAQYDF